MYDIVTLEPNDNVVRTAVNTIVQNTADALPDPGGNYRYTTPAGTQTQGDGGAKAHVLVLVGHGSVNSLSGHKTWKQYAQALNQQVDFAEKKTVYIVACQTAGEGGQAFLHGNLANEVKSAFPHATVWAASTNVGANTLTGDWQKL